MNTLSHTINADTPHTNTSLEPAPTGDQIPDLAIQCVSNEDDPPEPLTSPVQAEHSTQPDELHGGIRNPRRAELRFRRDSFLAKLTPQQLGRLCQWLTANPPSQVRRWIALPAPEGFGLGVHETTLRRFKAAFLVHPEIEEFRDSCAIADEYADALEEDQPNLSEVLSQILLKRALNIARNPDAAYNINELIASVVKLRDIELRAERLRLERQHRGSRPSQAKPSIHEVNLNIRPPAGPPTPALTHADTSKLP